MYRTIVVPLDQSAFSEFALPVALDLARRCSAELRLVSVATPPSAVFAAQGMELGPTQGGDLPNPETPFPIGEVAERELEEYLAATVDRLEETGDSGGGARVAISHAVERGVPSEAIRRHAREVGADLVVMTTHARGPVTRVWLGSVADEVVREASFPVLLIRPEGESEPDFERREGFRHILVPVAEWEGSGRILADVEVLAETFGAKVTLLHVESMPRALSSPYIPHVAEEHRKWAEREREVEAEVDKLGEGLRRRGVDVAARAVAATDASDAILDFAEAHDADLIAMATRGRRGLDRLIRGSVSDEVRRAVGAAVLLRRVGPAPASES
ncbi:MAG: universal stress protein [Gemmatimonadota bacterium]